jgi:hypothetical protein
MLVDQFIGAADEGHIGMIQQEGSLLTEPVRHRDIVSIEPRYELSSGAMQREIEAARLPHALPIVDPDDPRIRERIENARSGIRRPVVDDHQLEVTVSLCEDTVYRRREVGLAVVHGEDDADRRGHRARGRRVGRTEQAPGPATPFDVSDGLGLRPGRGMRATNTMMAL